MVALAFGLAGSALGGAMIGGAMGSQIGWMVGQMIGNALFPPPDIEGPKLSDLKMTTSAYGQALPLLYGAARISGNCIWSTDMVQHKHSESVGKGGGQQSNTYTYTVSCAYALCQGPITDVRKIWANSELVYDSSSNDAATIIQSEKLGGSIRIYKGTESQMPDPFMEATDGEGLTPAYRGTAYIMFQDLDLSKFGNATPNFEFEVIAAGPAIGPRRLSDAMYNFDSLSGGQFYDQGDNVLDKLYYISTGGHYGGGFSLGFALIAGVHPSGIDIVADGMWEQPAGWGITESIPAYNENRWTVDAQGNFISNGSRRKEYLKTRSYYCFFTDPVYSYTVGYERQYLGKAGRGILYGNRIASRLIGEHTISGAGTYPCNVPRVQVSESFEDFPFDISNLWDQLQYKASGYINGVFPSPDGSKVLITTGSAMWTAEQWHLFSFTDFAATYEESGTVDPTAHKAICFGSAGGQEDSGMVEEDGKHLWNTANGITAYEIGDDGVMRIIYNDPTTYIHGTWGQRQSIFATEGVCFTADCRGVSSYTRKNAVGKESVPLADIVLDICKRSGLAESDVDVSELDDLVAGVVYGNQMSYRSMIDPLRTAYFFDAVERDGKLVFVKRGHNPVAIIPEDDLAATDAMTLDAPPDQLKITRMQELELPREVDVNYFAADADYQDGSQYDAIQTKHSLNVVKLSLPIALSDNKAKQVAMVNLYSLWAGRKTYEFSTNLAYSHIDPTDSVIVAKDGEQFQCRITKRTDGGNGIIQWQAVSENATVDLLTGLPIAEDSNLYLQIGEGGTTNPGTQTIATPGSTELIAFEAPALTDAYSATPSLFLAANGYDSQWLGAELYQSTDGGVNYMESSVNFNGPTIIGRTSSILPPPASIGLFDEASTVRVFLTNKAATLANETEINVLNGANSAMIGNELVGFKRATMVAPRQYILSGLLRGRKGTEDQMSQHTTGENFVLLNAKNMRVLPIDYNQLGSDILLKAKTFGGTLSDSHEQLHTIRGRNATPPTPVYINAYKNLLTGHWILDLQKRAMIGGEWIDLREVMIDKVFPKFDILYLPNGYPDMTGSVIKRTITDIAALPWTYTPADQTTDFGGLVNELTLIARQESIYGNGPNNGSGVLHFSNGTPVLDGGPSSPISLEVGPNVWMRMTGTNGGLYFANDGITTITTIGAYGNAQTSTTQAYSGNSSASFSGATYDRVALSNSVAGRLLTNDFTIQAWIRPASVTGYHEIVVCNAETANKEGWFFLTNGTELRFNFTTDGTSFGSNVLESSGAGLVVDVFQHVAAVRKSGVLTLYLQGVPVASGTRASSFYDDNAQLIGLGGNNQSGVASPFNGYIDDFILHNGTALWDAAFTPPLPHPDVWLKMNGSNGSTTFTDSGFAGLTLTPDGAVVIDDSTKVEGNGSALFNGVNTSIYTPHTSTIDLSAGTFTIEFYIKTNALGSGKHVFCKHGMPGSGQWHSYTFSFDTTNMFFTYGGSWGSITTSESLSVGAWTHISICSNAYSCVIRKNGSQVGSGTLTPATNYTGGLYFGKFSYDNNAYFNGHLDDFRIWNGRALRTADFYVKPIPDFVFHGDTLTDVSLNALTITPVGSATSSTAQAALGMSASAYLDGINSYFSVPTIPAFTLGTGRFTAVAVAYVTAYPGTGQMHIFSTKGLDGFGVYVKSTGHIGVAKSGVVEILASPSPVGTGAFFEVAVVREGGTMYLFINGSMVASATSTHDFAQSDVRIGSESGSAYFNGYIAQCALYKDNALWTASYTPATTPIQG